MTYCSSKREGEEAIQTILPARERHFAAVVNGGGPASYFIFDKSIANNASRRPAMNLQLNQSYDWEARVKMSDGALTAKVYVQPAGEPQGEPYLVLNNQAAVSVHLPDHLRHVTHVIDRSGTPAFQVHFSSGSISDVKVSVIKGSAKILNWKLPAR